VVFYLNGWVCTACAGLFRVGGWLLHLAYLLYNLRGFVLIASGDVNVLCCTGSMEG